MVLDFANEINVAVDFNELIKKFCSPYADELYSKDQRYHFFKICQNEGVNALPVLFKIFKKTLILQEYNLNNGLCESLANSFKLLPDCLTKISLT